MAEYNRNDAVSYALFWALRRNPAYYDFSDLGGDCTNFVSQCVYAGCKVMNYTPVLGWYYISSYDRAPAWSGTEYFYDFMVNNKGVGPYASEVAKEEVVPGDIIQFVSPGSERFNHSLIVTGITPRNIYVCAHTFNALMRPLSTYIYTDVRFIHIEGVRS